MAGVRFAPSPTGAFHLGNFRTAWISHRWAELLGKPWVLRFEDIDGPRVVPGARERQLEELQSLGLEASRIELQSDFHARHEAVFETARAGGRVYPCYCSRRELRESLEGAASAPHGTQAVYNGRCRALTRAPEHRLPTLAWRFRMEEPTGIEDFIVARTLPDGSAFAPAYNWACAIDDWDGRFDLLVRAWDLEPVVRPQRAVQAWLAGDPSRALPAVYHAALVTRDDGHRLEKRTPGITLGELEAAGWTAARLLDAFERSWQVATGDYAPGRVFGESKRALRLSELGIGG